MIQPGKTRYSYKRLGIHRKCLREITITYYIYRTITITSPKAKPGGILRQTQRIVGIPLFVWSVQSTYNLKRYRLDAWLQGLSPQTSNDYQGVAIGHLASQPEQWCFRWTMTPLEDRFPCAGVQHWASTIDKRFRIPKTKSHCCCERLLWNFRPPGLLICPKSNSPTVFCFDLVTWSGATKQHS